MRSIIKSLTGNMTYTVKVHGPETKTFTQLKGLGQGPVCSPNKYNTSMEPLLKELEAAGAGVQVEGKLIMGVEWSDDLYTIVQQDNLEPVLRCIERASKTFRKNRQAKKGFAMPMCRKQVNTPRPKPQLDGKDIPTVKTQKILGFTLVPSVHGTQGCLHKHRSKTGIAIAKLESLNIHNGSSVRPLQTKEYYQSTVMAVMKANLAPHQLVTINGDLQGYEVARQMTAKVLRRMLGASGRTSPHPAFHGNQMGTAGLGNHQGKSQKCGGTPWT
jgi:hypothetical protein